MDRRLCHVLCIIQLLVASISVAGTDPSRADVRIEQLDRTDAGHKIVISGPIDESTLMEFSQAMVDVRIAGTTPLVELDSPGGSVYAAIVIGTYLRRSGFDTGVPRGARCDSACVLVLAAGVRRIVDDGEIGIHRPYFQRKALLNAPLDEPRGRFERLTGDIQNYLWSMGVGRELLSAMLSVPSRRIRVLTVKEVAAFGLKTQPDHWHQATADDRQGGEARGGDERHSPRLTSRQGQTKKLARRPEPSQVASSWGSPRAPRSHSSRQAPSWPPVVARALWSPRMLRQAADRYGADHAWSATMYFSGARWP